MVVLLLNAEYILKVIFWLLNLSMQNIEYDVLWQSEVEALTHDQLTFLIGKFSLCNLPKKISLAHVSFLI